MSKYKPKPTPKFMKDLTLEQIMDIKMEHWTKYTNGKCYDNCFEWLRENPEYWEDCRIVHGFKLHTSTGDMYEHAWIENQKEGWTFDVYDTSSDGIEFWYNYFEVEEPLYYTIDEALDLVEEFVTSGPWQDRRDNDFKNYCEAA